MHWASGILVFAVVWWVVLFAVLPWGVKVPDNPAPGHATSAPERPLLGRKMLVTTGITAVIWVLVWLLVRSDLLSFREMARHM